jgi:hypothetical protein
MKVYTTIVQEIVYVCTVLILNMQSQLQNAFKPLHFVSLILTIVKKKLTNVNTCVILSLYIEFSKQSNKKNYIS